MQTEKLEPFQCSVPSSPLARRVFDFVKAESPPYLHNHCVRVYFFAEALGQRYRMQYDADILFIACMMHDLGIVKKFHGKTRFEIDGADAAVTFLKSSGVDDKVSEIVWDAIALHTTTHIPLRKRPEIALVHLGAAVDITGQKIGDIAPETVRQILEEYPRINLKANILDDFISYLKQNPSGGMGYWLSQIAEKHLPIAPHFDFEKTLKAAPFPE
jgi:hypothetical protein